MANIKKTCLIHQQQGIGDLIFIQKIIKKYVENDMDFSDWQDYVPTKRDYAAELALWDHLGLKRNTKYTLINEFSSNGRIEIKVPGDAVYMRKIEDFTLFDWITVLERCNRLITVDTACFPNGRPESRSYGDFKPALRLPWKFTLDVSDLKLD